MSLKLLFSIFMINTLNLKSNYLYYLFDVEL